MIDSAARLRAKTLLQAIQSQSLSSDDFELSWPVTQDPAVRSIKFWIWTLFDDDRDRTIEIGNSSDLQILNNAVDFLSTEIEFYAKQRSALSNVKQMLTAGVEWRGCELPWHDKWPFPSVDR